MHVIAVTTSSDYDSGLCLSVGINSFLSKPLNRPSLFQILSNFNLAIPTNSPSPFKTFRARTRTFSYKASSRSIFDSPQGRNRANFSADPSPLIRSRFVSSTSDLLKSSSFDAPPETEVVDLPSSLLQSSARLHLMTISEDSNSLYAGGSPPAFGKSDHEYLLRARDSLANSRLSLGRSVSANAAIDEKSAELSSTDQDQSSSMGLNLCSVNHGALEPLTQSFIQQQIEAPQKGIDCVVPREFVVNVNASSVVNVSASSVVNVSASSVVNVNDSSVKDLDVTVSVPLSSFDAAISNQPPVVEAAALGTSVTPSVDKWDWKVSSQGPAASTDRISAPQSSVSPVSRLHSTLLFSAFQLF